MVDILIRDISPKCLRRLEARAKRNGRSVESEAKLALERLANEPPPKRERMMSPEEVRADIEKWHKRFAGRKFTPSSAELIREDRER